jgi:hypothetical protein
MKKSSSYSPDIRFYDSDESMHTLNQPTLSHTFRMFSKDTFLLS